MTNPLPDTLVECPVCDGPTSLDPEADTVTCDGCSLRMDVAATARQTAPARIVGLAPAA